MSKMMSANLEEISKASENFRVAEQRYNEILRDLKSLLSKMNETWEGEAADACKRFMAENIDSITVMQDVFLNLKSYIDSFQREVEDVDRFWNFMESIFTPWEAKK